MMADLLFFFNNYPFVPLIDVRLSEKKYNEISLILFINIFFLRLSMGIFFEAKFYGFAPFLLYYPIKYNFFLEQNLIFNPILQYFYYFLFKILF